MFAVISPLRTVEKMCSPVRQHPTRIIKNPSKVPVNAVFCIWCPRRRPQPHLVIKTLRHRHRRRVSGCIRAARQLNSYRMHFSDSAVANQLTHPVIDIHGSIFRGPLKDTIVTFHSLTKYPAFFNGQCRFFALYILARFSGSY